MKFYFLISFLALAVYGTAQAGTCALTGADRLTGEVFLDGNRIKLPLNLEDCKGVVTEGKANLIFRNANNNNQVVTVVKDDDLAKTIQAGKSPSIGAWNTMIAMLKGDQNTSIGSLRMGEPDNIGFPKGTVTLVGTDLVFDTQMPNPPLAGMPTEFRLINMDGKSIAIKPNGSTIILHRRLLKPGSSYSWKLVMSTGQVIEGLIDTLSREEEAKVATRLHEINRSNVSNFNKRLQTCLLFNEYSLDYDTSQVIKEISQ